MLRHKNIFSLVNTYYRQVNNLRTPQCILVKPVPLLKWTRCYTKKSGSDRDKGPSTTRQSSFRESQKTRPEVQECGKPSPLNSNPSRDCAWEESSAATDRKTNQRLLAALLITAGTGYAIWKWGSLSEEKVETRGPVKTANTTKKITERNPMTSAEIPASVPYLLIGGGTASFSAFRSIKSLDPLAKVLVISNEAYLPYMRPPLSKEMWFMEDPERVNELMFKQWNGAERNLLYEPEDFYVPCKDLEESPNGGVAVARGWKVEKIDPYNRVAILDDGYEINYEKCLLATGAKPKNLEVFEKAPKIIQDKVMLYRGVPDFLELNNIVKDAESIAIIGGGFLGSELACALARRARKENPELKVTQLFKEPGNMFKVLPEYLSLWATKKVVNEGVNVISEVEVEDVMLQSKNSVCLMLSNGKKVKADKVIVAVGVDPNTDLAEKSELEVEPECGGFLVNAELEARSHLFAAGDCSCFYDVKFGRRRVEHHDHAVLSGRLAGENMVGKGKPYLHQSMFWSDLGPEVGYEAIGIVDASLPTVGVFAKATEKDSPKGAVTESGDNIRSNSEESATPVKPGKSISAETTPQGDDYGKGVIFYLRDEEVVGILLWNVYNRMSVARQVLKDERKYEDLNEVAKLFNIFDD